MQRILLIVSFLLASTATVAAENGDARIEATCRRYFKGACSEAMGRWLPRVPNVYDKNAALTTVDDEIVDPAGTGAYRFLEQREVFGGSFFVYGEAGPPKGHAVYDAVHKIVFYDRGCCSWHEVVAAMHTVPPPKSIRSRTLTGLHTKRGIRFGDGPSRVRAVYGPAVARPVASRPEETTISYRRPLLHPPHSACEATTTFLFVRDRLSAMNFGNWC